MRDSNPSGAADGPDAESQTLDGFLRNTGHNKDLDGGSLQSPDGTYDDADASGEGAEHNKNIMSELPDDLRGVVEAWPALPEYVKDTIITLVKNAVD